LGSFERTTATLRFIGEDLDPDVITQAMKRRPTASIRKGDAIYNRRGVQRGVAKVGNWRFSVADRTPGDLCAQIAEIVATFHDDLAVWRALTDAYEADLFCGLFLGDLNDAVFLSPDLLGALSARGVELSLDVYSSVGPFRRWEDGAFVGNGSDYD
jgi:hypothetical protein